MKKSLFLLVAISLGILIPQASTLSWLIYYLLMVMLFFPFLTWDISLQIFKEKRVYIILLCNVCIGLGAYFLFRPINNTLAMTAFLIGITPTATACPAVMGFLKGRVDFAIATVIVTNIFMSLFLPFAISQISDLDIQISNVFTQTTLVIFIPLILGQVVRRVLPRFTKQLDRLKPIGFYTWLLICFIAVAKASDYIRNSKVESSQLLLIFGIAAVICLFNFSLGKILGGKKMSLEMSQTLGQKNTTLTIWIGMTYFSSIIALGPIFYLICHNLYNAYQLAAQSRQASTRQ